MMSKINNKEEEKVNDKINKLCSIMNSLSQKDANALSYIINKTARISSVAFILADVLEKNADLQNEIQRSAIGLVKDAVRSAHSQKNRESLSENLISIVTLLDVAQRTGSLSKMNTETLANDIVAFLEFLEHIGWQSGRRYVDESLFSGDAPRELFSPEPILSRSGPYYGHERDTPQHAPHDNVPQRDLYMGGAKKDIEGLVRNQYKEKLQEIQKDRRATILGLVQKKDRITVKDVANVIKDCSEKTLQRELLALVRQGVLKKEGERRWSTYTMA